MPNAMRNGFGQIDCGIEQAGCPVGIAADWRVQLHEFVHGMLYDRIHRGVLGFAHNGGDGFSAMLYGPRVEGTRSIPWLPVVDPGQPGPNDPPQRCHNRDVAAGWAWGGTQDECPTSTSGYGYGAEQILSTTLFRIYSSTGGDFEYFPAALASRFVLLVMTRAMASLPLASTGFPPRRPTRGPDQRGRGVGGALGRDGVRQHGECAGRGDRQGGALGL